VKMCSNGFAMILASFMNESFHIWMSHVARENVLQWVSSESCHICEWVVSQMNASFHVWVSTHTTQPENMLRRVCNESSRVLMSNVTYEWVMLHMNEWGYIWISHTTWEWVMSHMDESYHMNESFALANLLRGSTIGDVAYERATLHMNESCHKYDWVMSHVEMSYATHIAYEWVVSCVDESRHVWHMSHV